MINPVSRDVVEQVPILEGRSVYSQWMVEVSTLVYARWNPPEGSNLADLEGVWNDLFIQCKRLLRASRNGIS